MVDENAVGALEETPLLSGPTVEIDEVIARRAKLGQDAVAGRTRLLERKKAVQANQAARRQFCEERGIDLERAILSVAGRAEKAKESSQHTTPTAPTTESHNLNAEESFLLKTAKERGEEGFTMEELPALIQEAGLADMSHKEARQPWFQAVLKLETDGLLQKSDAKRGNKTVYIATAK